MKPFAALLLLAVWVSHPPTAFSQTDYEVDLSKIQKEIEKKGNYVFDFPARR